MLDTEHDDPSNESEGPLPVVSINHPSAAFRSSTIEGTHTGTSEVTEEVDTSVQSIQSTVNSSIDFVDITETENNPSQLNQDESTIAAHHPLSSVEDHDVQTRAREEGQPLLPVMVGQTAQVREEGQPLLPVMVGQTAQVREEGQPLLPVMVGQTAQVREEGRCPLSVIAGQTTQSREERQSNEPMRSATTSNTRDNVSTTTSRRRSRSPSPDSILQEPEALTNVKKHKGNQQDDVTLRDIITRADNAEKIQDYGLPNPGNYCAVNVVIKLIACIKPIMEYLSEVVVGSTFIQAVIEILSLIGDNECEDEYQAAVTNFIRCLPLDMAGQDGFDCSELFEETLRALSAENEMTLSGMLTFGLLNQVYCL
ncbi:uncharacterized protein [Ptychodera flava]|uniref:uncharacterized protein n=1 Tax=Ptychodera flava TaxID=63121 RepID=UPI00396A034C